VSFARSLAEARAVVKAGTPDGMLLDLHLPDGSGLDFLRDLRAKDGTARLPILVLTAEGDERVLREARRLGAALVTKPFSPTKLSQRIATMFGDVPVPEDEAS
jgi:DNA-binding response OmpR family regulator